MKIQPITTWKNGQELEATNFIVSINGDNCDTMAVISYQLFTDGAEDQLGELVTSGQLVIQGEEYQTWDSDPSANAWIYNWSATQLNLTITGEYVPPVPPTPPVPPAPEPEPTPEPEIEE